MKGRDDEGEGMKKGEMMKGEGMEGESGRVRDE